MTVSNERFLQALCYETSSLSGISLNAETDLSKSHDVTIGFIIARV